jgi:Flp pilus assembly pilin Flp
VPGWDGQQLWAWPLSRDNRGVAAVEYALLAALIAAVTVGVAATLGTGISGALHDVVAGF